MASSVNLDISQQLDITCRRGDTFVLRLTFTDGTNPIDLGQTDPDAGTVANYSFSMDVRESDTDDGAQALLSTDETSVASGLTRPLTVTILNDGSAGEVELKVEADVMAQIPGGSYVYDFQANSINNSQSITKIETWLFGAFTVNEDVTIRNA